MSVWLARRVDRERNLAGAKESAMAVIASNPPTGTAGIVVTRRKPGHFVVLTEDSRTDAVLAQGGVKLADALEKRATISVHNAQQGPSDGSSLSPAAGVRSIDPYDVTIAMPAEDGEPVVSDADREAWGKWRYISQGARALSGRG